MDKIITFKNLDLSAAVRVDLAEGLAVTTAPDENGDMQVSMIHVDAEGDAGEYFSDRVKTIIQESGGKSVGKTLIQEAAKKKDDEKGMGIWDWLMGAEDMSRGRIISVVDFDDYAKTAFINRLMDLDKADPEKPIVLLISSRGGYVHAMFGMAGFTRIMRAPVYTLVLDMAYSCGAFMAACAAPKGNRFATANARIMLHEVGGGAFGRMAEVEAGADAMKAVNDRVFQMLADNTGLSVDEWKAYVRNPENIADRYMYPEEAIKLGLIDAVLTTEDYEKLMAISKPEKEETPGIAMGPNFIEMGGC